ncbi:MAG: DUF4197 domain-containing protein [Variovorax sp.]|nr:MAG: DUF4197 domain-containing protein [Variovorax sp.]
MQRRHLVACAPALLLGPAWALNLSEGDANAGIRTALERGANAAVALLGRQDGFLRNPLVKIELPAPLRDAAKLLRATGQGARLDELVTAMNRAAEAAVPAAKPLLLKAVRDMSVEDGVNIVRGGDDSVTQFFTGKTREPLHAQFLPIVTRATHRVALADKYNAVAKRVSGLGLLRDDEANVQQYVTGKALDGLFRMIGEEEKKIRRDPVGTGSAILRKVFGAL